ncbi:hypothetical protein ACHMW6_30450 [Pseudoduganella sp. UC29_106]|uniref:hypothetical protein n=1 Tax=Pseudoduganella sp. UC29_106 TaxID=3374553 RepID=UPI003756BC24
MTKPSISPPVATVPAFRKPRREMTPWVERGKATCLIHLFRMRLLRRTYWRRPAAPAIAGPADDRKIIRFGHFLQYYKFHQFALQNLPAKNENATRRWRLISASEVVYGLET